MRSSSHRCSEGLDGSRRSAPERSTNWRRGLKNACGNAWPDGSHSVFVAEEPAGKIIGYGSVHWLPYLFMSGPEGYVSELFVSASARGQGIGRELLKVIESEARVRGCQRLSLTNLRNRESYKRQFYLKAGWQERSEAANFIYVLD
jgi:GNAT superfamily N-acetyltransferase